MLAWKAGIFMRKKSHLYISKTLNSKAFTLIELLIALSLTLLLGVAISKIFVATIKTATITSSETYAQKNARIALRNITKDLVDAENVISPREGDAVGSSINIVGLTQKNKLMASSDNLTFRPADSTKAPFVKGKPAIVYIDGQSTSGGYTVDYPRGQITFSSSQSGKIITADFSYDLTLDYSLNIQKLKRKMTFRDGLSGDQKTNETSLAEGVKDSGIFKRTGKNLFEIKLKMSDYSTSTVLDISNGIYVTDVSDSLPALTPKPDLRSLYFTTPFNGWVVGSGGTALHYENSTGLPSWSKLETGTTNQLNSVYFLYDNLGYAAGDNGTFLTYGGSWAAGPSAIGSLKDLYPKDSTDITAAAVNGSDGSISNNSGGSAWTPIPADGGTLQPVNALTKDINRRYAVANAGYIYKQESVDLPGAFNRDTSWEYRGPAAAMNDVDVAGDGFLYFSNTSSSSSIRQNTITKTTLNYNNKAWGSSINAFAVDAANNQLYEHAGVGVWRRNMTTGTAISAAFGTSSISYGLDLAGNYVYAIAYTSPNRYIRYNLNLTSPTAFNLGLSPNPWALKADVARNRMYVSNATALYRYRLDTGAADGTVISMSSVGTGHVIRDMEIDNNGFLWAISSAGTGAGRIIKINPDSGSILLNEPNAQGNPSYGIAIDNEQSIYTTERNSSNPYIYRYKETSGGVETRWKTVSGSPFVGGANLNSIAHIDNANNSFTMWVAGNAGAILKYSSTGDNWTDKTSTNTQNPRQNLRSVHFFDEQNGWAAGEAGTIIRFDAELDQWFEMPSPITTNLNEVFMYGKDEGYIAGDNGTLLKIESVKQ